MNLAEGLRRQLDRLAQLLALLTRERDLLGAGRIDGDALTAVALEKQQVLSDIDAAAKAQRAEPTGADRQPRNPPEYDVLVRQVRARAHEAAQRNRFNGDLIAVRMTANQRILNELDALLGRSLYGPNGHAHGGSHRLASQA